MKRGNSIYGGQTSKNIYLGDTRIVKKLNSGEDPTYQEEYYKQYYYHSDHLGSASLISDYQGDEYQRLEYTPYGETWVEKTNNTGLEFLPYKFTGKELDEETGLYYYGARYLDPKYSMWLSTDPALSYYVEGKSNGTSGGIFNSVNLNLYHYAGNNPIKYTDPTGMELEEGANVTRQLEYLKGIVNKKYDTPQEKADAAKALRNEMRNKSPERFDIDGLLTGDLGNEKFMNEDLRDFLNTSDTGLDYTLDDMQGDGWNERDVSAAKEHQTTANPNHPNRKFVNDKDGREAVFTYQKGNWVLSKNERDKGTYNYAKDTSSWHSGWTAGGDHGRCDMNPYFRQFGITPIYRSLFGHKYSRDDYNRNNK